jgi:acetylcholinesterase
MKSFTILSFLIAIAECSWIPKHGWHGGSASNLIVEAPSGTYRGLINGSAPDVREFLGIPFGQPPTGDLRWEPPQKPASRPNHVFDATQYPPSCPQYVSKIPTIYNTVTSEYIIAGPISEDCLALSVWTPADAKDLPVIMFIVRLPMALHIVRAY